MSPRRDCVGAPITQLGFGRAVGSLVYDAEVVQCVGKIRMDWPELCLLKSGSLTQVQLGGDIVAGGRRLLRGFDNRAKFARLGHEVSSVGAGESPAAPL